MSELRLLGPRRLRRAVRRRPQLTARLRIEETTGVAVHAIALRCQVRIEPQRRRYNDDDATGLRDLFGDRERWSETLRPFLWMQCSTTVQGFTGITEVDLPLPCTYDFEVIGSRYLHAVGDGDVPLSFMFSGTIFTKGENGFGVEQVPVGLRGASHQMPVAVWHEMIDSYFPNTGWIRLAVTTCSTSSRPTAREHGLTSGKRPCTHLLALRARRWRR